MRPSESVWEYPRPPVVRPSTSRVRVVFAGNTIAETTAPLRVLETSHPPAYYIPIVDVAEGVLTLSQRLTFCEFKGVARYFDLRAGTRSVAAGAWFYPQPAPGYEQMKDHVAFYPALMDECWVDGDLVQPQPGTFYGGWITPEIQGPFKGG